MPLFDMSSCAYEGPVAITIGMDMRIPLKSPDEPLIVASGLQEHMVVGFNALGPPIHDTTRPRQSPASAWLQLTASLCTRIEILDDDGRLPRPITLHLAEGPAGVLIPDFSKVWNWRPRHAKLFVFALAECELVTEELAAALAARMGRSKKAKRSLPKATRAIVMAKTGGKCTYCGVVLTTQRDLPNSYHADHVLSVRDGATDDPGLLVPACADCNQKKGAKTFAQFAAERE